jgi:hypothetical protein
MAQTVASTAAKASYTQSTPSPLIVPALPSSIKKDPKLANNWKTTPGSVVGCGTDGDTGHRLHEHGAVGCFSFEVDETQARHTQQCG